MFLNRKTILYFIPHPREELEIMGADIRHNLSRGHRVHVILCTFDGEDSAEKTPLETAFRNSCLTLGVKELNIHLPKSREKAGCLTLAYAEKLIKNHLILWDRNAVVCTVSRAGSASGHPDWRILSRAAENQLRRGLIRELRLFPAPQHPAALERTLPERQIPKLVAAAKVYPQPPVVDPRYCYLPLKEAGKTGETQSKGLAFYAGRRCSGPNLGSWQLVHFGGEDAEGYRSFCQCCPEMLTEKNLQRLADGSSFWGLVSWNGELAVSGWLANRQAFYIGEADLGFRMEAPDTGLVFALTPGQNYRGAGLYPLLLGAMAGHPEGYEQILAFTTADNTEMRQDILEAGFAFQGTFSGEDNSLQDYLKNQGFTGFYRKKQ